MDSSKNSADFYASLDPFIEFDDFLDFTAYRPVPDDWVVMAGDIIGSTQAIAEGRYKAVNMVGAAVITAVLNACPRLELPFSFGGDGGVVMVPESHAGQASAALQRLQAYSARCFGLDLRCAAVPMRRLRPEGHDIRLRKLCLNRRNHLAMFAGTGIDRVDAILKYGEAEDPDLLHPSEGALAPDLEGLSCRWEPLVATRSRMMALMVLPAPGRAADTVLKLVLSRLNAALEAGMPAHAPAGDDTLRFRWPPSGLALERRFLGRTRGRLKAWIWVMFTALAQKVCHRYAVKIGAYDGPKYFEELKAQTDFRKFDGCFRTVLDCSEAEIARVRAFLESERRRGRLLYGMHIDRKALMTCLVFSLHEGEHVHFIDAAGGGFAKAAAELKAQMAER